ncbi:MAG: carboxymuconolactone decarboxylase family protein [Tissierellales bacterium]|nr:carboxymuconolactone decarboxylase family protein [Tissierellales bacterium]MBN2827810.1 carboxymuconolactone decarboxylase family protein [Tissierellales bacterium]
MKRELGRKLYSISELYWICYKAMRTIRYLSKAKKSKDLDEGFIERIMLAVTEVNGCAICSYAHSKMALEAGMSNEEIQKMLAGIMTDAPPEEMSAVMFAQYYAESRGNPSAEAWNRIVEIYGLSKARGILGAIRIIMLGNAYGIPWSSFFERFKGKPDVRSNILYETAVIIIGSLLLPVAMIHAVVSNLLGLPINTFR